MGLQFYSRFGSPDAITVTDLRSIFNSSLNAFSASMWVYNRNRKRAKTQQQIFTLFLILNERASK